MKEPARFALCLRWCIIFSCALLLLASATGSAPTSHADNETRAQRTCYAQVPLSYFADMLRGPSYEQYGVKRVIPAERELYIFGRDESNEWVHAHLPGVDMIGWMRAENLMLYGACDNLPITTDNLEPESLPEAPAPVALPAFAADAAFVEEERVFLRNPATIYALHESEELRGHIVLLDLSDSRLRLSAALVANPGVRTGLVSETAAETGAFIAINADFWTNSYVPQNLMLINGEIITAPTNRATFAATATNEVFMGYFVETPQWDASVTAEDGAWVPLQWLNTKCEDDWLCLYTDIYPSLPLLNGYDGRRLLLSPEFEVLSIEQNYPLNIPDGHFALRTGANSAAARWLREHVAVGDSLTISLPTDPDWRDYETAVGGGPIFIRDGQAVIECDPDLPEDERICENFDNNFRINHYGRARQARAALGYDADNNTLILMMIEGNDVYGSKGATQDELAAMMLRMGADSAMEFDGGRSASLWIGQNHVNGFTTTGERYVSNALLVFWDED